MRKLSLILFLGIVLISCSEEEPAPETISKDPLSGAIDKKSWIIASAGGRYGFSDGGAGKTVETISIFLFKKDHDLCYSFLDTSLGPYVSMNILPKEGKQTIGVGTLITGLFLQNVNYPFTIDAEVVIEELDTTGIGFVKGRLLYQNSYQGSPSDRLEGSFETTFCRDTRKPEYLDQNAKGIRDGNDWQLVSGGAIGKTHVSLERGIFLFDQQVPIMDVFFQTRTSPRLVIEFPMNEITLGEKSTEQSNGAIVAYVNEGDPATFTTTDLVGRVEILSIDNMVRGRIDLFAKRGDGYEFNGNFEIPYF